MAAKLLVAIDQLASVPRCECTNTLLRAPSTATKMLGHGKGIAHIGEGAEAAWLEASVAVAASAAMVGEGCTRRSQTFRPGRTDRTRSRPRRMQRYLLRLRAEGSPSVTIALNNDTWGSSTTELNRRSTLAMLAAVSHNRIAQREHIRQGWLHSMLCS